MEKALRGWLNAHGLPAIITAVMTIIIGLALLLVVGGYFLTKP